MGLVHNELGHNGLGHNMTGTQRDWCSAGHDKGEKHNHKSTEEMGHTGTRTQQDWHNGTGAQRDFDRTVLVELGHNGIGTEEQAFTQNHRHDHLR